MKKKRKLSWNKGRKSTVSPLFSVRLCGRRRGRGSKFLSFHHLPSPPLLPTTNFANEEDFAGGRKRGKREVLSTISSPSPFSISLSCL